MDLSSIQKLCLYLISCAIQRCRESEDICRLSVVLKCSPASDPPLVRISISDTGVGSCLEEFQDLKFPRECVTAENWDGLLSVRTTSSCDNEIYNYHINLKESISSRRLTRLPSNPKNGANFSGTEVCLSISESVDVLLVEFNWFFQKMLVLKIPNVAIELVAEHGDVLGSRYENLLLANDCNPLPFSASNIERLKSGLEDYVLKHRNSLSKICDCCLSNREHLKIGSGTACSSESNRNIGLVMDAAIIISDLSEPTTPCSRACEAKTEVLYFKNFSPCSMSQSSLNSLTSIDWKSYGLTLGNVLDQGGCTLLEWENLPAYAHIDIVLHCYHNQVMIPPSRQKTQVDRNLIRKAVKFALDDLKENHAGVLLSAHALKVRSYAPDLARTIAGLILSSNDTNFQGECLSLLGLQYQEVGCETVKDCIEEKLISVIEMNDRKPLISKEAAAPFLFEDDCIQEPGFQDEEFEEGEDPFFDL